jgi:TfoX/Sxy family transcriptional regulator of competence genes
MIVQIPKPTDEERAAFLALVPERPDVTVKPMFGNVGAYVNGAMFMGTFGSDIGVKLGESDRQELLAIDGAGPFGPEERPMGGYVSLPPHLGETSVTAEEWVVRALDYVASLPPKPAKNRRKPS